ncbi:MAG: hypothetical protein ACPL5F_01440 [Moorellaceae bacterium]
MEEIVIEYENLDPEDLLDALKKVAEHEALWEEMQKAKGSEKNIWEPSSIPSLAKLENWITRKIITPLEAFRRYFYSLLGLKPGRPGEWEKYVEEPVRPAKELNFPAEAGQYLGVTPFFVAKLDAATKGKVRIEVEKLPKHIDEALKLPEKIKIGVSFTRRIELTPAEKEAAEWAARAAALKITQWANAIRDEIRWEVAQAIRKRLTPKQLEQVLHDRFGQYAADLRRVAITELNDAYHTGYLLNIPEGTVVRGVSAPDACSFCLENINGKEYIVSHKPEEDAWKYIWPGKTNFGRKRQDWVPTIPVHPNCRCLWVEIAQKKGD